MKVQVRHLAASCAQADEARGIREARPNWGPEIRAYLANCDPPISSAAPWCAAAVQYWTDLACRAWGVVNPLDAVLREAYVQDYFDLAQSRGWAIPDSMVDVGDLALFRFPGGPARWNHIGIVTRPPDAKGLFMSVEGNTGDPDKDQRDGDGVYLKTRSTAGSYRTVFVRWDRDVPLRIDPPAVKLAA